MSASASNGAGGSVSAAVADILEEVANRLQRGEPVDPEAVVREHREHAEQLRQLLPAVLLMARLEASARGGELSFPPSGDGDDLVSGVLGDFRILRELGRGGMGVVYEAEQISLRRRVALKVLPFAAVLDPRHLQRFRNEALAAAALDHPNIVKVHAVGCERGVHFIAMQLIDGRPLSELIRDMRRGADPGLQPPATGLDPTAPYRPAPDAETDAQAKAETDAAGPKDPAYFRRVAEWGVQAAEALEYAHSVGVVHRDVKPGNLLLDGKGSLWVADFGLAKLEAGEGVTMTGDLLGTLRYMSPEQALARHGLVDHRTDVYALGATLYELLTLRPVVDGKDRQEVFKRIAFEEPEPPRKSNRAVPKDLETIVLKALRKEPGERYASARELADDLQRFLEHKPVRAKRLTLRERAVRWAVRNPRTVVAFAVVITAIQAVLVAWDRERTRADATAREAMTQAEDLFRRGRLPEAEAVARRAAALLPRFGGDSDLRRQTQELVKDITLLRRLGEARLKRVRTKLDSNETGNTDSLEEAASAFREEYGVDVLDGDEASVLGVLQGRTIRTELAAALVDWACTTQSPAESRRLFTLASSLAPDLLGVAELSRGGSLSEEIDALRKVALEAENDPPPSPVLVQIGMKLIRRGDPAAGLRLLRIAQRRKPDDVWIIAVLLQVLRDAGPGYIPERLRHCAAFCSLRPKSPVALEKFGEALVALGRYEEAIEYFRMAEAIQPEAFGPVVNQGLSHGNLGHHEEAVREFRRALAIRPDSAFAWCLLGRSLVRLDRRQEAVECFTKSLGLERDAGTFLRVVELLYELGRLPEAEAAGRAAVDLDPTNPEARFRLGLVLLDRKRPTEAAEAYRWSLLLRPEPSTCYNLGLALSQQGKHAEAEAEWRQAIRLKPDYFEARRNLGRLLLDRGNPAAAIPHLREATRLRPDFAPAHYNLGLALKRSGQPDEAVTAYRQAIHLNPEHAEAHCNLGQALRATGQFGEALVALRRGHALGSRRSGWRYPSGRWVRECERLAELESLLTDVLAGERKPADAIEAVALAEVGHLKHLNSAAASLYRDALTARPALADDPSRSVRYNAACAAALAGGGEGGGAQLDEPERSGWRTQARSWLRADLRAWRGLLDREPARFAPAVLKQMRHWQQDADLDGVRDPEALARLPEAERGDWQRLWREVEELRRRAESPPKAPPPRNNPEGLPMPKEVP